MSDLTKAHGMPTNLIETPGQTGLKATSSYPQQFFEQMHYSSMSAVLECHLVAVFLNKLIPLMKYME